ncbi:YqiA/YcfP family alpha/beta fold hydrolase [Halomonas huangheensis]|uniref:Esterase n=1 Tax=Halomonas huangheensis TaxID=1178482 RepID=W1N5L3_9GAMM|nr:YqiA/YcfP family alpha/beta fold hydrolase [Halomonas huangheensis]ALM51734.1 esterase [Halomonas huangheensis]ERL50230.1 hypothetical protein BJB45_03630 [Halomonas huangheensis]
MLDQTPAPRKASGVLYLHGFNSAGASPKARLVKQACEHLGLDCSIPDLSALASVALETAQSCLEQLGPQPIVMGSSMGGFLATVLAQRNDLRAVLINPAVRPVYLVESLLGQRFVNEYTGERFSIEPRHRDQVAEVTPEHIDAWRYLLLVVTQDETLDSAQTVAAYRGARMLIHPGGEHGFAALADYLPAMFAHAGYQLEAGKIGRVV